MQDKELKTVVPREEELLQKPIEITPAKKKLFNILRPLRWLKNRYSNEVKEWTNPLTMFLFISTDWIIIPTLFITASTIFRMENLPEYKYEFLIGTFGFTASLAGLCSIQIKEPINEILKDSRICFIHAALIIFQCTALVFLVDQMNAPTYKPWIPRLAPFGIWLFQFLYSYLIAITGYLWFSAFAKMNDVFWTYNYSWKYHRRKSDDNSS